jgi:lipopolysaccharide export system protein LptA
MGTWTRSARIAIVSFVVTFAFAVFLGMQQRRSPTRAVAVDRTDAAAVIQSRSTRITLAGGSVIEADRQFAYPDGSVRLVGVSVTVPPADDRNGFRMHGDEASGDQETGAWRFAGHVGIETGDGLSGRTSEASYANATGLVTMPEPAEFEQGWMRLAGDTARYDRRHGQLHLDRRAVVALNAADPAGGAETRITANAALIARLDGYMRFTGAVRIDSADWRMHGDRAVVRFDPDASRLDALDLEGTARILGTTEGPGRLREMSAQTITVTYDDGAIDQATLAGGASVGLFGQAGAAGTRVAGRTVSVTLAGNRLRSLNAAEEVFVDLPSLDPETGNSRIGADVVDITAGEAGGWEAGFDGEVEYREPRTRGDGDEPSDRVIRANRLEAGLAEDLASLDAARFLGGVTVDDDSLTAVADEATYDVANGSLTLLTAEEGTEAPRVNDARGSTQAESITVTLDGPGIDAAGQVRSVLAASAGNAGAAGRRPGLLTAGERIYVAADRLVYDPELSVATYSATPPATARLWQDQAEFLGTSITLDEATGSLRAEGDVRTRTTIVQTNDETGVVEALTTVGGGESMDYDDATRRVAYAGGASLENPRNDLVAETIEVLLQDDARTLDRILASGDVTLELPGRRVTGETMAYGDADGRYEMEGEPVEIVEQSEGACRETTGRSLTFFITDEVQIDGEGEGRTSSTSGQCVGMPPDP